jgi:hypothetical protein
VQQRRCGAFSQPKTFLTMFMRSFQEHWPEASKKSNRPIIQGLANQIRRL